MSVWRSVNGMVRVEIVGADIASFLSDLSREAVSVFDTVSINDLTLQLSVHRQKLKHLRKITEKRGDSLHVIGRTGIYWTGKRLLKRPVLLFGLIALLTLSCLIPTRIWFFKVEGNKTIPSNLILEQASRCGISFGVSRRAIRSERMKNALLEALPQLQWAGINTSGCVATISVREREVEPLVQKPAGVSSIVAARDGMVLSCTVTKGSAACAVGQAVKAGEILISGYTDCGLSLRACRAEGEVFAITEHAISVCTPTEYSSRTGFVSQNEKYSLVIGKKRINFYKDSGILDVTCDKMVSVKNLTLPGGFVLPISLVTEVWTYYTCSDYAVQMESFQQQLKDFSCGYLTTHMIAGDILAADETVYAADGLVCLDGTYDCREMIGRVQKEEIIAPNGKHD